MLAFFAFLCMQVVQAQNVQISGTVTSADDGATLPGVSVFVKGTTIGSITDFDGNFSFPIPEGSEVLVISFVGKKTQEVPIGSTTEFEIVLEADIFNLDEVIVSGVSSATPRKKLTVTVEKVDSRRLQEVPATDAAGALQGKLAGVRIVNANGNPGSAPNIRLRGSATLSGSQYPLILIDGVIMSGTLADVNVDDIANMEVIKGASASAMYGSRAGNGVIVITTKRGLELAAGETEITVRTEYGSSSLANKVGKTKSHAYMLADDAASETTFTKYEGVTFGTGVVTVLDPKGEWVDVDSVGVPRLGNRVLDWDHYADNPYAINNDHQDSFYDNGEFSKTYVSIQNRSARTNFMASFENSHEQGILHLNKGFYRQNFRLNIDHAISDKLFFKTSNLVIKSDINNALMSFYDIQFMQPDVNLFALNFEDGSRYRVWADPWSNESNPYYSNNRESTNKRTSVLSSYNIKYKPYGWIELVGQYSYQKEDYYSHRFTPKNYITEGGVDLGSIDEGNTNQLMQTAQFTLNINKQFGDITIKPKISYLYEDDHYESFSTGGDDFAVIGVPRVSNTDPGKVTGATYFRDIRAENILTMLAVDFKGKYLFDGMFRMDGASQFGSNERWHPYYRVSAGYIVSDDITIPGIQFLKPTIAYGTSGLRPGFSAQYETYSVSGGSASKGQLGNKDLKPATVGELEIALNVGFLDRFDLNVTLAKTRSEDAFQRAPMPAATGWSSQYRNVGTLENTSFEVTLGMSLMNTQDMLWTANLTFDRIRQKMIELDMAPYMEGPGPNGVPFFWVEPGFVYGVMLGHHWISSLSEMQAQLDLLTTGGIPLVAYTDALGNDVPLTISDFKLNKEGYVIQSKFYDQTLVDGTEIDYDTYDLTDPLSPVLVREHADAEGSLFEKPVKQLKEDGTADQIEIGDVNPDFNAAFSTNFTFKGLSVYALFDIKAGGDVYNMTSQWTYREYMDDDFDQAGKADDDKKTTDYYGTFYNVAAINDYFVEDGSYLKIRELSVYYTFRENVLGNVLNGLFKEIKLGIIGRNLFTFTKYSGYDPEVASGSDPTNFTYDGFAYPNFRTFTGRLEFKF